MRVAVASRIFEPEPSAASFRLAALAGELARSGAEVEVLTVKPIEAHRQYEHTRPYRVKRFPVLRDRSGYVRGYAQYMSFDIPLFFRILFGRRKDAIVVEPPPTTGFFVRLAAGIRRIPYYYFGADIWSDATESTGAMPLVVSIVRSMERFALAGAAGVFSVNEGVTERILEISPKSVVYTVGNGVNTEVFSSEGESLGEGRFAVYTGTASEWQGADVFVKAFAQIRESHPDVSLVFLGQGSAWPALKELAAELESPVKFVPTVPPEEASSWLRGASFSLASIAPDGGYDFAFPTKIFASWATGTPVLYAGPGPARAMLDEQAGLGIGVDHGVAEVREALNQLFAHDCSKEAIASWAKENVSLESVAARAVDAIQFDFEAKQGA